MRKLILCPMCSGIGKIVNAACGSTGPTDYKVCHICEGSGRVWEIIKFEAYIPEPVNGGNSKKEV
jgi:DnaJ-class molecular chaperone